MFLNGELRAGAGVARPVHDRWTGREVGAVHMDGPESVDEVVDAAARAGTRDWPSPQRAAVLSRCADLLEGQAASLSALITAESGVCVQETRREVSRAAANLRVAAAEAERIRGESVPVPGGARLAVVTGEPIGIVAGITPFNRPLNQVVVKVAPALAAGCPIVLKPSEKTPLTALAFAEAMTRAGCPPGMLAMLTGAPDLLGDRLAGHDGISLVTFTGSVATGRHVARQAAGKRLLLELGGNDPLFVLPDTDLRAAAAIAADGALGTAGQSCRGVKRVIVWESVAGEFAELLVSAVSAKSFGDPHSPTTDVGPLISERAAEDVVARVRAAVADGARLLHGGGRQGSLVEPTVLDQVPPGALLVQEETFGPVAPVVRVRDLDEAVSVSNGTEYGLQAGVLTNDSAAFWELAGRLRVGAVHQGAGPQFDSPHIPFGGVKASGVGREGIRYSIMEMTAVKTITVAYQARTR